MTDWVAPNGNDYGAESGISKGQLLRQGPQDAHDDGSESTQKLAWILRH